MLHLGLVEGSTKHPRYVGTEAAADVAGTGGVLETTWCCAPAPGYR